MASEATAKAPAKRGKAKAKRASPKRTAKPKPKPAPVDPALLAAIREEAGGDVKRFYAERGYHPLWTVGNRIGPTAGIFIDYLVTAEQDGLNPSRYDPEKLREAIAQALSGSFTDIARAEVLLSKAFARYVADQKRSNVRIIWADPKLKPDKLRPDEALRAAAFPDSFGDYVAQMGWMSPQYVRLRKLAGQALHASDDTWDRLALNLDRARLLPGPYVRHIEVDASSGQLWFYEAGRQVGTMRVVVGARETQTPMMAGSLQWAILNPYWNVPTYLARNSIAPKVLAGRSLASLRMEALTDWSANARVVPESAIDWQAVAAGTQEVRLRELPGTANSMGRVKFLFPNDEGIYLHDTPRRDLLAKPDRHFSNGCIRLENAGLLGRWLLQRPVPTATRQREQAVPLPLQVPVYLTYLTATGDKTGLAFRPDVYGRDG
ncbi:murein L,D-transpeptidase YcbB/YkuD [Novosphingobium chloroacetimidivorans]|uniref:Murein L,D-transpeptidase YcbB/YkuD n=1 Tax=Novosphingobium chloroacetimidivorans TaxID=1428314 RepID=A0A7W7KCM7_9SPHN|nr:L,D-transpeptidase family protein [Novosphingobium chloroacetimidivorans]MBB4860397.1 murein L,D-transpeptidase YcbB/YkuD [Novosphingobium chloroacetimidivorans]